MVCSLLARGGSRREALFRVYLFSGMPLNLLFFVMPLLFVALVTLLFQLSSFISKKLIILVFCIIVQKHLNFFVFLYFCILYNEKNENEKSFCIFEGVKLEIESVYNEIFMGFRGVSHFVKLNLIYYVHFLLVLY